MRSDPNALPLARRGEGWGEGSQASTQLQRLMVLLCLASACGNEVVIGIERQVSVRAAVVDPASGELLQAGTRQGDLWYARTRADGSIVREQRLDFAGGDDAVTAAVLLPSGGWAIAGHVTRDDGKRSAWVRTLDGADAEVWTKTYEQGAGWAAQGLALDPVGTLVVVGIESVPGGIDQGFVARLDESGGVRWKYSTYTDLQNMVLNLRLHAVATIGVSQQRVVTVGERTFGDQVMPELSQFNMTGDFYDSLRLEMSAGSSRGLLLDAGEATVCVQRGDDIVLYRSLWTKPPEVRNTVLHVDGARLELGGCVAASDGDLLVGATAVFGGGRRVARAAKVERMATAVRWERDVPAAETVTVAGVAADGEGSGWVFGHTEAPLRRWAAKIP